MKPRADKNFAMASKFDVVNTRMQEVFIGAAMTDSD
jgi:hypothetical protein